MTLQMLAARIKARAAKRRVTRAAILSEIGISERTYREALRRGIGNIATAARLLPLVAAVAQPGEPVALLLTVPGVAEPLVVSAGAIPLPLA